MPKIRGVAAVMPIAFCTLVEAQNLDQRTAFEVAAIKASSPDALMTVAPQLIGPTFRAIRVTLRQILASAFGMTPSRIVGPDWVDKSHFDIEAKAPDGTQRSEVPKMIRQLLVDRFRLQSHLEKRELSVYDVIVAKGGVRMSRPPEPERPLPGITTTGFPMMRGTITIAELTNMLSAAVGAPVIDKTGLAGKYNLFLSYSRPLPNAAPSLDSPPDLFTAIREQLGLVLLPNKASLDVVVIDSVDRSPSEN